MTREEAVIILDGFKNNPLFNDTHAQALDMAISALSEMSDLISRKSLLNKINAYVVGSQDKEFICKLIKEMPSAENKGEWIPVSERLPEERQSVLVWCPERRNIYCACLEKQQWWIFGAFTKVQDEVVAWMPLPEPYKAEKGGEE